MGANQFVGIAQMRISRSPDETLVAANLGSCLGVAVYESQSRTGGLIHCLLPTAKSDPEKAAANPYMYVDSGVPLLLDSFLQTGIDKRKLIIVAVGGANMNDENKIFEIGKKNYTIFKKLLWKNGLLLRAEHIGDSVSRTLSLHIGTGKVSLKIQGETIEL